MHSLGVTLELVLVLETVDETLVEADPHFECELEPRFDERCAHSKSAPNSSHIPHARCTFGAERRSTWESTGLRSQASSKAMTRHSKCSWDHWWLDVLYASAKLYLSALIAQLFRIYATDCLPVSQAVFSNVCSKLIPNTGAMMNRYTFIHASIPGSAIVECIEWRGGEHKLCGALYGALLLWNIRCSTLCE